MKYLIILLMCILATSKMSFQSAFGKKSVRNTADAVAFNGLVFVFSALLFSYKIPGCSLPVWAYASIGGAFSVLFQLAYTKALAMGNVSLTVLIVNFQMVITVLVSYFMYGDDISGLRLLGILLTIVSFFICTDFKESQAPQKKWLITTLIALAGTSISYVVLKIFGESAYSRENQAYVACHYVVAAIITLAAYCIIKRKGQGKTFRTGKRAILFSMAVGLTLAVFQAVNTYAISVIPGTFLFPAYSGGTVVFSTLSGVFVFKDKLSKKQIFSIIIGITAIVLKNF